MDMSLDTSILTSVAGYGGPSVRFVTAVCIKAQLRAETHPLAGLKTRRQSQGDAEEKGKYRLHICVKLAMCTSKVGRGSPYPLNKRRDQYDTTPQTERLGQWPRPIQWAGGSLSC